MHRKTNPKVRPYEHAYQESLNKPEMFWARAAEDIEWTKPWVQVLDSSHPPFYRWFKGGELNVCYNALDRHVEQGRAQQLALIYDSPVTNYKQQWTYVELRDEVAQVAGALQSLGVTKGDRVLIYMSMVPEALMAMLACARIGAIHSVVFGGFAASELAARINDAHPKLIIASSGAIEITRVIDYMPLLNHALELATVQPQKCLILQRPFIPATLTKNRDLDWHELVKNAKPAACVSVAADHPSYILYTSGTTGHPKGIVRDTGGHAVALKWSMQNIYNVEPGDVFWAASDVGWVVGHSYIVYGPLLQGCTTVLYEGKPVGTPDAGAFWRVISEYKVSTLFTAPTAFRAIRRDDHDGKLLGQYDLSSLKTLFLAGERSDPVTLHWAEHFLKVPAIDHWWQTETGWPIVANCMGLGAFPVKYGSATKAVPGWDVRVLDEGGHELARDQVGSLVCKLPLPPGSLLSLWKDDARFHESYMHDYPGYYKTADAGKIDQDGYIYVLSRTDDVINVAGHRLSTGVLEEALAGIPEVAECAVIGVRDEIKGEVPVGFLILKAGANISEEAMATAAVARIRDEVGPVASFKVAIVVKRLPKTRSGKILRGTMKKIADGIEFKMPATIDDPLILEEIRADLIRHGFPRPELIDDID
jgi:propionyl-CoA synthetase